MANCPTFFQNYCIMLVIFFIKPTICISSEIPKGSSNTRSASAPFLWLKVWSDEKIPADSICIRGAKTLNENDISQIFVSSAPIIDGSAGLCAKMEYFSQNNNNGRVTLNKISQAPEHWKSIHLNSSAVSKVPKHQSMKSEVQVHNYSPQILLFGEKKGNLESSRAEDSVPYEVSTVNLSEFGQSSLSWMTEFVASHIFNSTSHSIDEENIGALKAAAIFSSDSKKGESTARYVLVQATDRSTVSFVILEAKSTSLPSEKRQRKLLQGRNLIARQLASTAACKKRVCFRLPVTKVAKTCKPGRPSYSACLYQCVCN